MNIVSENQVLDKNLSTECSILFPLARIWECKYSVLSIKNGPFAVIVS